MDMTTGAESALSSPVEKSTLLSAKVNVHLAEVTPSPPAGVHTNCII